MCVCACASVCACVCVNVCMCVCAHTCVCVCGTESKSQSWCSISISPHGMV